MVIKTVEEVRDYCQYDYFETGEISGFTNMDLDTLYNNRLVESFQTLIDFKDKKVLDLGSAIGGVVAAFHAVGIEAYGIDISDYAVQKGHTLYPPLKERTFQGSIHDLSRFKDNDFDLLFSNQVFEHLPGDRCNELAQETYRVTKPGGILYVGLVLDLCAEHQPSGYNPGDPDKTHINLRPETWWDDKMLSVGWKKNKEFNELFKEARAKDGYSPWQTFRWHSICYKK